MRSAPDISRNICRTVIAAVLFAASTGAVVTAADDRAIDFNRDIRPILSENCFYCHGQDPAKRKADLRLDHRETAVDFGAITPGDVENSSLLETAGARSQRASKGASA